MSLVSVKIVVAQNGVLRAVKKTAYSLSHSPSFFLNVFDYIFLCFIVL